MSQISKGLLGRSFTLLAVSLHSSRGQNYRGALILMSYSIYRTLCNFINGGLPGIWRQRWTNSIHLCRNIKDRSETTRKDYRKKIFKAADLNLPVLLVHIENKTKQNSEMHWKMFATGQASRI